VITLYDPSGASSSLWEENYTALSVIFDNMVITRKLHSDVQGTIQFALNAAFD
jgi:hypothetical protein